MLQVYRNDVKLNSYYFSKRTHSMTTVADTENYLSLFLNDIPMMDVRAPAEFDKGALPHAINLPLLDDDQRSDIGRRYRDAGQDEAIELGLTLATPYIREQRLTNWLHFIGTYPNGFMYCFRGGLRSRTAQTWLKQLGIDYPLIKGGYKAMRGYLLRQLDISQQQIPFVILSGLTGSGKTRVLKQTPFHIDLEGLANHRGSAFGRDADDFQPTQINWENQLSIACLKHRYHHPDINLLVEDEGRLIGRIVMPSEFYKKMEQSPRIFLQCDLEQRVSIIREDYITSNWSLYQKKHTQQAVQKFSEFVLGNLVRIKKRLGGARYDKILNIFKAALDHLFDTGQSDTFDEGIRVLLLEYYDPMYRYQLQKKPVEIIFKGTESDILEWTDNNLGRIAI